MPSRVGWHEEYRLLVDFMRSTEWMMLEVLVPVQGHCLTFPPSGARLATLLCQGGGEGARGGQGVGFARAGKGQMDRFTG